MGITGVTGQFSGATGARAAKELVGKDGAQELFDNWKGSPYDANIFKGEKISYEDLQKKESFLKAAALVYEMKEGKSWAQHVKEEGWSAAEAKSQLGERGISDIRWFNNNIANTGYTMTQIMKAKPEMKQAFLYMMDAYDHTKMSWNGFFNGMGHTLADPTTYVGIGTLGVGTAAAQAGKKASIIALRAAMKQGLAKGLVGTEVRQYASKEVGKQVLKTTMKTGAKIGAIEGAVWGGAYDSFRQGIETDAGRNNGEWNWGRTGMSTAMGSAFGGAFGAGMPALGAGTKGWGKKSLAALQSKGFLTPNTTAAAREATQEGAEAAATKGGRVVDLNGQPKAPKTYWQKLDETSYNQIFMGQAAMNPLPAWGKATFKFGRAVYNTISNVALPKYILDHSWVSRLYMGDTTILKPSALTANGTILPQYHRGFDTFKFWMRRTTNPAKLFTNWAPITNMPMESRPVTRQVFNAVDRLMAGVTHDAVITDHTHIGANSIIKKLQKLQDDILDDMDAKKPTSHLRYQIQKFARDNATDLDHLKTEMQLLRNHINTEFKEIADRPNNAKDAFWLGGGEHKYYGLNKQQKETLLAHLDELIEMPDELKKGVNGVYGQQIMATLSRVQKREYTTDQIRQSVSGLSRAHYLADMSEVSVTGKFARDGSPAYHNWKEARMRSVQNGYHNPEHFYESPVSLEAIKNNNLEKQWQNQVLPFYKTLAVKDADGKMTSVGWTDPIVSQFASLLAEFHTNGHGHDVSFIIEDLMRRRQQPGHGELYTVPSTQSLRKAIEALPIFKEDAGFQQFSKQILKQTDRWHSMAKGVRGKGPTGLFELENFKVNRMNMAEYATQSYIYSMTERYPGSGLVAKPGTFFWNDRRFHAVVNPLYWLAGAKSTGVKIDYDDGGLSSKPVWMGDGEHFGSVVKRGLSRTLTGGLANNIKFHNVPILNWQILPWPSLTKLGKVALLGGGLILGGKGCESTLMDGTGSAVWNVATLPVKTEYKIANNLLFGGDKDAEKTKTGPGGNQPNPPGGEPPVGEPEGTIVITNPEDGHVIRAVPAGNGDGNYMFTVTDASGNDLSDEDAQKYMNNHPDVVQMLKEDQNRYNQQHNAPNGSIEPGPSSPPAAAPQPAGETQEEIEARVEEEAAQKYEEELKKLKKDLEKTKHDKPKVRKKTNDSREMFFGPGRDESNLYEKFNDQAGKDARTMLSDNSNEITRQKKAGNINPSAPESTLNLDDNRPGFMG